MKTKLAAFFATLAFAASSHAAPVQYGVNGHWYEFISGSYTWQEAFDDAATRVHSGLQGYLATVTTAGENSFIAGINGNLGWLGGSDDGAAVNQWTWRSGPEAGQAFTFTAWNAGEPNNCCGGENFLHTNWGGLGLWNDHGGPGNPWQRNGYFVEFSQQSAVPEPGVIALLGLGLFGFAAARRRKD